MTRYTSGYRAEREVSQRLRNNGYYVMESRGSHGMLDIVAIGPNDIILIQVKSERLHTKAKEVNWNKFENAILCMEMIPNTAKEVVRQLWVKVKNKGWEVRLV